MLSIDFKVKFFLLCNFYLTSGSLPAAQKSHYHTSPLYTARQKIMNMNDLIKWMDYWEDLAKSCEHLNYLAHLSSSNLSKQFRLTTLPAQAIERLV